ncbi:MAG: Yip1 family protein [Candidatus Eisenbacteria bacterium]
MNELTSPNAVQPDQGGPAKSVEMALRVLFSPAEVFEELNRRPRWLVPLVICVLLAVISSWILIPSVILPAQREALEQRGMTEEQLEAAGVWLEGNRALIIGIVSAVVVTCLMFVVVAGVFHLVCGVLLQGKANFVRTFAVVAYSQMVMLPEVIVKLPIQMITKKQEVQTSLALLLDKNASESLGYRLLYQFVSQVEIFTLWKILLISMGLSVVFKFSRRKGYYVGGGAWLAWAVLASVVAALVGRTFGT